MSDQFSAKRSTCKDCKCAYSVEYYKKNKEACLSKMKDYRGGRGKEIILEYRSRPDVINHRKSCINDYYKQRKQIDPAFRCITNLRIRQWQVVKGKASTTKGLGCDSSVLRGYLESLFTAGMSWDNYGHGRGKWVIDHIKPLQSHYKTDSGHWDTEADYNKQLMHYTNLQPLWFEDNARKGSHIV